MEELNHDEQLLARWLANELTDDELAQLQQREDYADLQAIVDGMKGLEMPAFSEEESWKKLEAKRKQEQASKKEEEKDEDTDEETAPEDNPAEEIQPEEEPAPAILPEEPATSLQPVVETPIRSIGRRQWMYAAAATVALLLVALLWLRDTGPSYETMITTNIGEQRSVTLPDGSTVELNAETTLGFTETDWADERNVYLSGEGFFRAKKGKTFTVVSDQGNVAVVGTQFNVYARDNELDVKCTEGRVQVINPKQTEKVLIKTGEQVSVINGKMQKRKGIDFTPKWYRGESVFQSAPRSKVFKEFQRQYGVVILSDGSKDSPFTGKFVHDDFEKALRMISVPMNLEYEVKADTVRFWDK